METDVDAALLSSRSVETSTGGDDPTLTCLGLFGQLEASLYDSQKALLARDLAGVEQGTREQRALTGKIEAILRKGGVPSSCGLEVELRECGKRVLAAGRRQAALLARARRRLRVLVNMLAGPSINYGPMLEHDTIAPLRVFKCKPECKPAWKRAGEI